MLPNKKEERKKKTQDFIITIKLCRCCNYSRSKKNYRNFVFRDPQAFVFGQLVLR